MAALSIGIYGGTFDPIHVGHLHLVNSIYQLGGFQKILLIPAAQPPLRSPPLATPQHRFNMVKLAIKDFPYLEADPRELYRTGISYTVDTLSSLRQEYSAIPLILIMGVDVFNRFAEWRAAPKILELAHILVANRPGYGEITNNRVRELVKHQQAKEFKQLQKQNYGLVYLVDINPLAVAAAEIRRLLKGGREVGHLVTPSVLDYIKKNSLYR